MKDIQTNMTHRQASGILLAGRVHKKAGHKQAKQIGAGHYSCKDIWIRQEKRQAIVQTQAGPETGRTHRQEGHYHRQRGHRGNSGRTH